MLEFVVILDVFIVVSAVTVSVFLTKKTKEQKGYPKESVIDPLEITIQDVDHMEDGSEFEEYLYHNDTYKTLKSHKVSSQQP
ncbi:hypothetical protein [Paenibacillus sp. IHBB 3054]|uniref:hypothetical protein n=1 Tax=Paenibacillus sp. IHBB 3054 TaxID=3425689 RepID=UPI003F671B4E